MELDLGMRTDWTELARNKINKTKTTTPNEQPEQDKDERDGFSKGQ